MDSGLIKNDGTIISCPYYGVEELCKKIIEIFCSESEENRKLFLDFAKNYTYFSPYFDFAIDVLGYTLINPWLFKNHVLTMNQEEKLYQEYIYSNTMKKYIPITHEDRLIGLSSDKHLEIKPFEQKNNNYYPCFITEDLIELYPKLRGHRELAWQLLNLGMIKDKELCEEIQAIKNIEDKDMAEVLMWFWPLLRFDSYQTKEKCFLVYRSDNVSNLQLELINKQEDLKYAFDQSINSIASSHNWSNKFYSEERRKSLENKRI